MNVICLGHDTDRAFWRATMHELTTIDLPFYGSPYVCLLWPINSYSLEERMVFSTHLLQSGCRYVVCGGPTSTLWEATIDEVAVTLTIQGELAECDVIMTTAHPDESPEDVVFFFIHCTTLEVLDASNYVLMVLGDDPRHVHMLEHLIHDQALA